ncbi:MAG: ACP phosphodiesterase [Sumerlaeia bacterium]
MNYLAHLVLSDHSPESMVGNVLADFIRGRAPMELLEPRVRVGVRVHRAVDRFCDEHAEVRACGALLKPRWGRYSGIITDIYFDYVLASGWDDFGPRHASLRAFADQAYTAFAAYRDRMPDRMQRVTDGLTRGDGLVRYGTLDGIEDALTRVSRRFSRPIELAGAIEDLIEHRDALAAHFALYWPQARAHAARERDRFLREAGLDPLSLDSAPS